MEQSTETDLTFLQNEDAARAYIHFVTPLIQAAVQAAIPPELSTLAIELSQARQELADARADFDQAKAQYVTAEEAKKIGEDIGAEIRDPLSRSIDKHLKDLSEEDTKRNQAFDQRIGEINALVHTNERRIATHEATSEQRFKQIESRLERIDRDIDQNVKSVAKSAQTMNLTFAKFLEKYEKKAEENERDIQTLQASQEQVENSIGSIRDARIEDVKELRRIENRVNTESNIVRDIDGRVMQGMNRMTTALFGDKDTKEPGLVADVRSLQKGLNWLAFFGTRKGAILIGAGYVLFLIVTAFILGRPEIATQFIPGTGSRPN